MVKKAKIIYFDQETIDDLKRQKDEEGTSASAIVRRYVKEGLRRGKECLK